MVTTRALSSSTTLAASTGSSLIGHIATGTGATARMARDKLRDFVSVKDFGATGDGVTDDTTAIANCLAAHLNVYFPEGTFIATRLTLRSGYYAMTLQNSWVAYDANWESPQSYIDAAGIVQVTGAMKSGTTTAGTVVSTLPAGPFVTYADTAGLTSFYVLTNGDIVANGTLNATRTSLCGISFKAA